MSDTTEQPEAVEAPRRGRPPRAEVVATQRRRRQSGSLNRLAQMKLDCIDPAALDLENYVYRWVNEENGRLRQATKADDYDFVSTHELGDSFDAENTDSESSERVRMLVGSDKGGNAIHSFLCRKPRTFWEADNEEAVRNREDMMAGRVYRGEAEEDERRKPGDEDKFYVPPGTSIGHAAERRRGPVPKRFK